MKVECVLKRPGGTRAELDGIEYHFEPLDDGAHVADVANDDHVDRFLAIPEGYKVYRGALAPAGQAQVAAKQGLATSKTEVAKVHGLLHGSINHLPQYTIGGHIYALADVVRKAFEASGLTEDDWNDLEESDREAKIDIALDTLADAAEQAGGDEPDDDADDAGETDGGGGPGEEREADDATLRAELVEQFKAKFGRPPHPNAKIDTIKAKLAE